MKKSKLYSMALVGILASTVFTTTAQAESISYKVQKGDSLWKIATTKKVTVSQLKQWNNLKSDTVKIGQTLTIQLPDKVYKVKSGDTLPVIAKSHNLLIADIKIANKLTTDVLKPGQSLTIPSKKGSYATHSVKRGETLSLIARDYSITLSDLKSSNKLNNSDVIKPGQILSLKPASPAKNTVPNPVAPATPLKESTTTTYIVKSGDTLSKLANTYHTSIQEIKRLNNLSSDTIYIGKKLNMPSLAEVKEEIAPASQPISADPVVSKREEVTAYATIHIVEAGDYLYKIATKYDTTVSEIKRLNNLTSDMIHTGQDLKVTEGAFPPPTFLAEGFFPLPKGMYSPFVNSWGYTRTFGGERTHEGADIMAPKGTSVYASFDGIVSNYGWSELGGWRISIKTSEGYFLYYAHLSQYAPEMKMGASVKRGQLIGYVGDTGYGTVGTTGKFAPHLHFGIYDRQSVAVNPYPNLRYWEAK